MTDVAKKRLLITGMAGFTGQYVRDEFLRSGWEVYGCAESHADITNCFQVDILHTESVRDLVSEIQPNAVIHLAGIAFAAHRHPIDYYGVHVQGTLNLLDALTANCKRLDKVLLVSTANVYGNSISGVFNESAPLKPFNDYGVSKLAMEYMAWLWRESLPIVIVRPFNYTGIGQAQHFLLPKIIRHFSQKATHIELGNLHVRRDFSDVRDVATAYRKLVECTKSRGAVNVTSGVSYSVSDVLKMVSEISGHKLDVVINHEFVRGKEVDLLSGRHEKLNEFIGSLDWIPLTDTIEWMIAAEKS